MPERTDEASNASEPNSQETAGLRNPVSTQSRCKFEWRKSGKELHGYTITDYGTETRVFEIFRSSRQLPRPWFLYRNSNGSREAFRTFHGAKNTAEFILCLK